MTPATPLPQGNPFSTRHVRPGAIPYQFPPGDSMDALLSRLEASGWWGQIIGPHGTGKSTLVAALLPALQQRGREPSLVRLHERHRRLPPAVWAAPPANGVLVLDGFEQLPLWVRWRLQRHCRRSGWGLLVTAHRPLGLPDLHCTEVKPDVARSILAHLLGGQQGLVDESDLFACLAARGGNLREALFDLYDSHERRRFR
jgi:hypothetical protein